MAESSSFGTKWEKAGVKQQHAESVCGANQHPGLRRNAWSQAARQRHSDESFASPVMRPLDTRTGIPARTVSLTRNSIESLSTFPLTILLIVGCGTLSSRAACV